MTLASEGQLAARQQELSSSWINTLIDRGLGIYTTINDAKNAKTAARIAADDRSGANASTGVTTTPPSVPESMLPAASPLVWGLAAVLGVLVLVRVLR